jgi:hypothetical protein
MPSLEPHIANVLSARGSEAGLIAAELTSLIEASPMQSLGEGPDFPELRKWINQHSRSTAPLVRCGLWLLCGDLNASHEISQTVETPDGSFWHGIMHRREGDFWNSKYWFRRVGKHPVLAALAATPYGDAQKFVDRCEAASGGNAGTQANLAELQWQEWQELFAHTVLAAGAPNTN